LRRLRESAFFFVFVDVFSAVPQLVAFVFVGQPAAVFVVIVVVPALAAPSATIPDVLGILFSIRKPESLGQLLTSRHGQFPSTSVIRLVRGAWEPRTIRAPYADIHRRVAPDDGLTSMAGPL